MYIRLWVWMRKSSDMHGFVQSLIVAIPLYNAGVRIGPFAT
jgi:hypothetical protein